MVSDSRCTKITAIVEALPWYKKLRILQLIEDWDLREAAQRYGSNPKNVWAWNEGRNLPQRKSRRAIAAAHQLAVTDIFPVDVLKPDEIQKGA